MNSIRALPFFFLIALLSFGPILFLLYQGLNIDESERASLTFVWREVVPGLLSNTFWLVLLTCSFAALFGLTAAILTQLTNLPFKRVFDFLFIIPLAFPLYVLSFIYVGGLEFSSPLLTFFRDEFSVNLHPYLPIKTVFGVSFVFALGLFPYVYLFLRSALKGHVTSLINVGKSLGKSPWQILFKIILPYLRPWLFTASVLVAMETLADFGGVTAFNFSTFTTAIYQAWSGLFSLAIAARLSLVLVVFAFGLYFLEKFFAKKVNYAVKEKPETIYLYKGHLVGRTLLFITAFSLIALSSLLPLGQLLFWAYHSFDAEWGSQYHTLLKNTVLLGVIVALLCSLTSFFLTSLKRLFPSKLSTFLTSLGILGYALPGNIIAVAVFIFFSFWFSLFDLPLYNGIGLLALGLLIRYLAVSYRSQDAVLRPYPTSLDHAAFSLGARPLGVLTKIHFPLFKKGLFLGAILTFIDVIKEMPMAVMLRPFHFSTLSVKIYELTVEGEWERAAVGGLLLVSAGLVSAIIYAQWGQK